MPRTAPPPRFERRVKILVPGKTTTGPTGQRMPGIPTQYSIRASRIDVPWNERVAGGLQLAERVTRFVVRRGDVPDYPNESWRVLDDRGDTYDIVSVDSEDDRRDNDPRGFIVLLCRDSQEVR